MTESGRDAQINFLKDVLPQIHRLLVHNLGARVTISAKQGMQSTNFQGPPLSPYPLAANWATFILYPLPFILYPFAFCLSICESVAN
jgi:hypothetical protein